MTDSEIFVAENDDNLYENYKFINSGLLFTVRNVKNGRNLLSENFSNWKTV